MKQAARQYKETQPLSICHCGHTGDGANSQHGGYATGRGKGYCVVDGCQCRQFSWAGWTPEAKRELKLE